MSTDPDPQSSDNCGGPERALAVFGDMIDGVDFTLPEVDLTGAEYELPEFTGDLYEDITALTNDDLTTGSPGGDGTFDVIMASNKAHIKEEHQAGRITGDQYAKAYVELTTAALSSSVQFLLGRDQAKWQAIVAQMQARKAEIDAITARVQLATMKAELAKMFYEQNTAKAGYALTKMKLATEDASFCMAKAQHEQIRFQVDEMLPAQLSMLEEQERQVTYQTDYTMVAQYDAARFQVTDVLPKQLEMIEEQVESERSKTLDTRTDGATIVGSVGKQKDLYDQQITSYQRDAEYKTTKMYLDAWITQKTIDEGLTAPDELTNAVIDAVLASNRTNNGLSGS